MASKQLAHASEPRFLKASAALLEVVASQMSHEKIELLGHVFSSIDTNQDGQVSLEELYQALSSHVTALPDAWTWIQTDKEGH